MQRVELSDSWFSHLGTLNFSPSPPPPGLLCLLERDCLGAGAGRNKQQPKREQVGQVSGECPQGINKILERKGCGQGGGDTKDCKGSYDQENPHSYEAVENVWTQSTYRLTVRGKLRE